MEYVMDMATYLGCSDDQVSYGGHNDPRGILIEGKIYEIEDLVIESYVSRMMLKGIEGSFNSVCFEFSDEIFNRYLKDQGW